MSVESTTDSGTPDETNVTPVTCQPPSAAPTTPPRVLKNGSSYMKLKFSRCGRSRSDTARTMLNASYGVVVSSRLFENVYEIPKPSPDAKRRSRLVCNEW